jgi:hypothetical protein
LESLISMLITPLNGLATPTSESKNERVEPVRGYLHPILGPSRYGTTTGPTTAARNITSPGSASQTLTGERPLRRAPHLAISSPACSGELRPRRGKDLLRYRSDPEWMGSVGILLLAGLSDHGPPTLSQKDNTMFGLSFSYAYLS